MCLRVGVNLAVRCSVKISDVLLMADLEPYRFEPERRAIDDSSSAEEAESSEGDEREPTPDEDRVSHTRWCSCGNFESLPSAAECLCCQEMDELGWNLHGLRCITEQEDFAPVYLNRAVLRTAVVAMADVRQDSITEPLTCRLVV